VTELGEALAVGREGRRAAQRLEQRGSHSPHVGRRRQLGEAGDLALLRRHVRLGPDGRAERAHVPLPARDAQVDQARPARHDDVARLDVEVQHALGLEIAQEPHQIEPEREQLLDREAAAAYQRRKAGTLDVLEHQVRPGAVEHGTEGAQQQRMRKRADQAGLRRERLQRPGIVHLVRAQELRDHERVEVVVPGEVGLVAPPTAEQVEGQPARDDLRAVSQLPGLPHGNPPPARSSGAAAAGTSCS
jgi:hypothetical protein